MSSRRSRLRWWLVFVALVVVPLAEIYVLIQVGQVIGPWWTIVLLILDSLFGSWLIRHEGRRAWQALREALDTGRMPSTELADGALILVGGTLMLSPGFLTDALGIVLILPFTRPLARRVLSRVIADRLVMVTPGAAWSHAPGGASTRASGRGTTGPEGPIVRGEVVD